MEQIFFTIKGNKPANVIIKDEVVEIKINNFLFNLRKEGRKQDHHYRLTLVKKAQRELIGVVYRQTNKLYNATDTLRNHVTKCPIRSSIELIADIINPKKYILQI